MSSRKTLPNKKTEQLEQIATEIEELHSWIEIPKVKMAYFAGEKLLQAKKLVGHGNFEKWKHHNLQKSRSMAGNYIAVHGYIQQKYGDISNALDICPDLSITVVLEEGREKQTRNKHSVNEQSNFDSVDIADNTMSNNVSAPPLGMSDSFVSNNDTEAAHTSVNNECRAQGNAGTESEKTPTQVPPDKTPTLKSVQEAVEKVLTDIRNMPSQKQKTALEGAIAEFNRQLLITPNVFKNEMRVNRHRLAYNLMPYPGGKATISQKIGNILGEIRNHESWFREPFTGAGSVTLNMLATGMAKRVWINDGDPNVAALWTAVICQPDELKKMVREFNASRELLLEFQADTEQRAHTGIDAGFRKFVLQHCTRDAHGEMVGAIDHAASDRWNRPGKTERIYKSIDWAHKLLKDRVWKNECTCLDALEVITYQDNKQEPYVLFVDPPYVAAGQRCYSESYTESDHRKLAEVLKSIEQPWLLTYDNVPLIRELYADQVVNYVKVVYASHHQGTQQYGGDNRPVNEAWICSAKYPWMLRAELLPTLDLLNL